MPMLKKYKNKRGLEIHEARMKGQVEISQALHAGIFRGKTQEMVSLEAHHSAIPSKQFKSHLTHPQHLEKKIKWPAGTDKKAWYIFDEDINEIFEITSKGRVNKRLIIKS